MLKTTLTALSVLTLTATPAFAGDFAFKFQKHELATSDGAETLYSRLEASVENFCTQNGIRPLSTRLAEKDCIAEMLDDTIAKIDDARLSRIYARETSGDRYAGSSRRTY